MKQQQIEKPEVQEQAAEKAEQKRQYIQAPVVTDVGLPCPHCGARYNHDTANTYNNGIRRMICGTCHKPFPARRLA